MNQSMINFIKRFILKNFLNIDLSGLEKEIAEDSIKDKYAPSVWEAVATGLIIIPAILFLDTSVLTTILIPITMVAGAAWFAISLANMKKKFENFGLELTTSMFRGFTSSMVILALLAFFSLTPSYFDAITQWGAQHLWAQNIASVLGIVAIFRILWNLFAGALKYDINDAMLTGQSEAAEKFFKKSLSLLYASAENLREGKGLEVANYYIGVSFHEVFSFIKSTSALNGGLQELMDDAIKLKQNPSMDQAKADAISISLIEKFIDSCTNIEGEKSTKSFQNIKDELDAIKTKKESQVMVDTRLSIIFEEIAELIELQGEGLFKKSK